MDDTEPVFRREIVHRLFRAGTGFRPVIVADDHAAGVQARPEELQRCQRRVMEIDIDMNQREFFILDLMEFFGDPAFIKREQPVEFAQVIGGQPPPERPDRFPSI